MEPMIIASVTVTLITWSYPSHSRSDREGKSAAVTDQGH